MSIKEKLDEWKGTITVIIAVIAATVGVIAWASDLVAVVEAKQQLIHDDMYQESRIARKEDQVSENQRELDNILDKEDDENDLSHRQEREVDYLDNEIARLRKEIENIRVDLETSK